MVLQAKRILFVLVFIAVVAGGGFAQSENVKNWITGEAGLFGNGIRYERILSDKWSVGGTAFWNVFFLLVSFGAEVTGRLYPWGGSFYLELGLGYGLVSGFEVISRDIDVIHGGLIAPGLGWKIDIGQPGGFFIDPSITIPITIGKSVASYFLTGYWEDYWGITIGFKPFLGVSYAF